MAAAVFMGFGTSALDGKGRFSLPAAFRGVLAGHCSNTNSMLLRSDGQHDYLALFGDLQADHFMQKFEEKMLAAANRGEEIDEERLSMEFWGGVSPVSIDAGGRFALPAGHKKHYGITDGLVIIGSGRMIQLWDPQRFLDSKPGNPLNVDTCAQFMADLAAKRGEKA